MGSECRKRQGPELGYHGAGGGRPEFSPRDGADLG
jgi:hypothetical protein